MRLKNTAAFFALLAGCALVTVDVRPAEAITLMDIIRGGRPRVSEQAPKATDTSLPGVAPGTAIEEQRPRAAAPIQKITGPRYYTYKAEPLRRIATPGLAAAAMAMQSGADPVVTASLDNTSLPAAAKPAATEARPVATPVDVKAPAEIARAVEAFYAGHSALVWVDGDGVTAKADAVLAMLARAERVGLDPADYAVARPVSGAADEAARQQDLVRFDVALTAAIATYAADTIRGRIDPNKISGYHDFKRKDVDLVATLKTIASSDAPAFALTQLNPVSPQFMALMRELRTLEGAGDGAPRITIAPGTLLKPGQSNPELSNIVAAIKSRGSEALRTAHQATIAAYQGTPDYAPELVALVEAFQKEHGLKPDGVVGNATIRVLTGGDTTASKIEKVKVAMEQARWLPDDLGRRYVFINQPAYQAYYHDGGREQFAMRVVVGSKSNQTYFFQDEIQTVEFNPYWGVPQSIIVNEMLPKLRNDPSYLDRLGYQVEVGGRAVASSSVNWYGSTAGVAVRQPPSSDNALGELKILFPNTHAIYMHDTPSKSFFKKDMRALSHGCVRLAEPRKMAAAVLGTSVEDIGRQIAGGANKAVSTPKIPVYVSYFTAWPDKDGKVEYFDDVYDRDMYMQRAFAATAKARRAEG
ncbi:Murein L,D-transpeptidase YcbB/YkuD [Rhizobium sp. RU20A]|uniref:L,D-transpeptidase family protein n=1 Tax=Rhizobium sp. RU20A TaxID=1907412 RepID=UPI0009559FC9|nr:L,D-transpeptidase family protein [Rhizobium sp. RU20A]SIQ13765.1 Murein L,D-transpeptidase YcbB/YkuD [Rhizobium sp. RU20A]